MIYFFMKGIHYTVLSDKMTNALASYISNLNLNLYLI